MTIILGNRVSRAVLGWDESEGTDMVLFTTLLRSLNQGGIAELRDALGKSGHRFHVVRMSMSGLGNLLHPETAICSVLPAGLSSLFRRAGEWKTLPPVMAQAAQVQKQKPPIGRLPLLALGLLPLLALAFLLPAICWIFSYPHLR
jgi:hypothetical protein